MAQKPKDRPKDLPVAEARPKRVQPRGIVIDPVVWCVGGAVALVGFLVVAAFLWMIPTAAAREAVSACRGMHGLQPLDRQVGPDGRVMNPLNGSIQLCPIGRPCQLPQRAPDFTAIDITGKPRKLSEFKGRVVLLNFWASWCGVCKAEKPSLAAMARELGGSDYVVLTVVSDKTWSDAIVALLDSLAPGTPLPPRDANGQIPLDQLKKVYEEALPNGIPFVPLLDPPNGDDNLGPITKSWGLTAVPETALIDRDGVIRAYFVNKRDWESPVATTCLRSVIDG